MPFFEEDSSHWGRDCFSNGACTGHWGLWMSPPACFWAGVGALVMLHGVSRDDKRSLALSYDLQLILAPVCLFAFVSLAWRALNSAAHLPYVFAGLSFVMQVQAAACLCGAYLVNSARKRVESGKRGRSEREGSSGGSSRRRLPRGWRERWTSDGRPFYEQRSTGRICWELTHCVSDRESGGEDGGGYETDIRGPGVLGRRSKTPPIAEEP